MLDHIEYNFWLTFKKATSRYGPQPKITKGEPQTARGERAIKCNVRLPSNLFATPTISMQMEVPEADVEDVKLLVETTAAGFKQTLGADLDIQIVADPQTEEETE